MPLSFAIPSSAQTVGTCDPGRAFADLDVNKVRARLYNNGGLFWRGAGPLYNVPKDTRGNAIFAHSIWIGGMVDGTLRVAASDYGPWEFWPGPLDQDGSPPSDCERYDRMYSVRRADIEAYESGAPPTPDLRDWPAELGAPVIDGDGNPDNYSLQGGDRPDIRGDQSVWWVMNDVGGEHEWSRTGPLGLEVRVMAYAFRYPGALSFTTFYRYELLNRGASAIDNTYFGAWVDADLGNAGDDYVGSDTTLGMGFAWNGDDFDDGADGYGDQPPAIGFDFVESPGAEEDGRDNDRDGQIDEAGEQLQMTSFMYYNGDSTVQGNPSDGKEVYTYLRALWVDGKPVTVGGSGRGFSETPITFMFPGNPPEFWSEEDIDGRGSRNTPADRRFVQATGPFSIQPGEKQTITFAIVFSQGKNRFDSVRKLKEDDAAIQVAFDMGLHPPEPPDAPIVQSSALDGSVVLTWHNDSFSNNYLDSYDVEDVFLSGASVADKTYSLEGYNVFRYDSENDTVGERIATFDLKNDVRRVIDVVRIDDQTGEAITDVVADGTDSGLRHEMTIDGLTNYSTYYFGVQAYAYSPNSAVHVLKSPVTRISIEPSRVASRGGGTIVPDSSLGASLTFENGGITKEALGTGAVTAEIVDPLAVTGHTYRLEFLASGLGLAGYPTDYPDAYNVIDETTGEIKFDGIQGVLRFGRPLPQRENVASFDGVSVSFNPDSPGPLDMDGEKSWAFIQVQGGDGIAGDACDAGAVSTLGCEEVGGNGVYGSYNGAGDWVMYSSGTGPEGSIGSFAPNDFEVRATETGSYGYFAFSSGNIIHVPAEVWDIGPTGPFGVNDPSDDVQMIPVLFSDGEGECFFGFGEGDDPLGLGWQITDRIYSYYSTTTYADWEAAAKPLVDADPSGCPTSPKTDDAAEFIGVGRPLQRLVWMMDPKSPNYRPEFIPVGNVIRFLTTKPNLPGDKFFIHTEAYAPKTHDLATAKKALDLIGIVPNPYKGVSDYEITNDRDAVRFTNLPDVATIRIYNLAGTLITRLEKTPASTGLEWDLTNGDGHHIASGMYLVHVDVPGVGERVLRLGVVKKRR